MNRSLKPLKQSLKPMRQKRLNTFKRRVRLDAERDTSLSTFRVVKFVRGRRLNRVGKKGREWIATRRRLSAEFAARGITSCELGYDGCKGQQWLSFAHGRKRRHLKGNELYTLTALLCTVCHDRIEYLPAAEMLAIIESVIANRKKVA